MTQLFLEMRRQAIERLAEREPAVVETVTKALRNTIDFFKTRGALLRAFNQPAPHGSAVSQE
jgi:hypothetical protein